MRDRALRDRCHAGKRVSKCFIATRHDDLLGAIPSPGLRFLDHACVACCPVPPRGEAHIAMVEASSLQFVDGDGSDEDGR